MNTQNELIYDPNITVISGSPNSTTTASDLNGPKELS